MPGPAFVRGDRVGLHTVEREDLPFLQRLRNDPEIRHWMTFTDPENGEALKSWFEEHVSDTDDGAQFLVCPASDEGAGAGDGAAGDGEGADDPEPEPVGYVTLFDVARPADHAEIAYYVAPEHQGEGYATAAVELLVEYAFAERRLHKVAARALETNAASRTVLERVGFTEEERQREELLVDGDRLDVVRYAVLEGEWG
jgi:RimJ/RimL family protein N-acetyltransferase